MYESFYGLTEKPFTLLPDPDYLYLSPKHQRALTLLEYGMMNQAGFSVICGDTGAGKTTLIRRLLAELGEDTTVGLITNTHQSFGDLLNWVLMAFGIDGEGKSKSQMHQAFIEFLIEQYAKNLHTVLIVDEAQNMNAETLEELRMLSNINADKDQVLQVILAGQPALRDTLRKPELMQFAQRISVDYYLESLSKDETAQYIKHRLKVAGSERQIFTEAACDAIYRYSGGTPRLINLLCDTTLVYGFAEQTDVVDVGLVDDVVREQHANSIVPTFNKPLTDEDINKFEKNQTVKPVVKSATLQKQQFEAQKKEAMNAGSASQAVSNYDAVSTVGKTEVETEIVSKADKATSERPVNKESDKNTDSSKVTPIKQAEQKPAEDLDNAKIKKSTEEEIQIKVDEAAVKEAMAQAEAELDKKNIECEIAEQKAAEEDEQKQIDLEEIVFEEVEHKDHKATASARAEDVYPIIHVEDTAKKSMKVLVLGFVGGLVLASILTVGGAYLLFGDKLENKVERADVRSDYVAPSEDASHQAELERVKLDAMQKERDAALAITKALERERDAALATAKAQESMRNAEMRAAEIIAEQERKAAAALKKATRRARQAELEAAQAKAREHKAKLRTIQTKAEADARIKAKARAKAETQAEAEVEKLLRKQQPVAEVVQAAPIVEKSVIAVKESKKKAAKFSANPCSSPSSKFLSTCKK